MDILKEPQNPVSRFLWPVLYYNTGILNVIISRNGMGYSVVLQNSLQTHGGDGNKSYPCLVDIHISRLPARRMDGIYIHSCPS